jgi:ZIP family zinc transporter
MLAPQRLAGSEVVEMGEAFLWGTFAATSLVIGAIVPLWFDVPRRTLGLVMALGSGVLIATVAYELVLEPIGNGTLAVGLAAGALAFFFGDLVIERMGGEDRKKPEGSEEANPAAIVLGTVLDGVPESVVLGLTLLTGEGISAAMVTAIFLSNFPESLASTPGLRKTGWPARRVVLMWMAIALVSGASAALGYGLLEDASADTVAVIQAFAAGALLTMLADTMMPTAFTYGGRAVGLLTTAGFALAFGLAFLE